MGALGPGVSEGGHGDSAGDTGEAAGAGWEQELAQPWC